jgi:serine/threonine-protein kinase
LKRAIWNSDWLVGVAFSAIFALAAQGAQLFYGLETAVYDRFMQWSYRQPSSDVAVIAIDDRSIDSIGRWPWSRDILASVIDRLSAGGARLIASTVFLSEPEIDAGLDGLRDLDAFYRGSELSRHAGDDSPLGADLHTLGARLQGAVANLDYDARLAASRRTRRKRRAADGRRAGSPARTRTRRTSSVRASLNARPFHGLARAGARGTQGRCAHRDVRRERARTRAPESRARCGWERPLRAVARTTSGSPAAVPRARGRSTGAAAADQCRGAHAGRPATRTPRDRDDTRSAHVQLLLRGSRRRSGLSNDFFYDVFSERLPADKYRGKIVLIGASAAGIGDRVHTPVAASMPPVLVLAHTVSALLEEHFYVRPPWARALELCVLALIAAYLALGLPRLRADTAALVSLALVVSLLGVEMVGMGRYFVWLQLAVPALLIASGHLVMTVKRFGVTEKLKQRADVESSESNRMLGLAFQGQGQLDMAFEKLRRCPLDANMMDLLYNLALDYESKRQLGKAGAVYRYMADYDPAYRDLSQRLERTRDLSGTLAPRVPGPGDTLLSSGLAKPRLGRYILEREVGHGAMGTVYQGRDPTINRVVAIKTIALSAEFDSDELAAARERFFREAESAGRLNHPDIVTVYDAGEEHDVAYIAMEFLSGTHLSTYTRYDQLLPGGRGGLRHGPRRRRARFRPPAGRRASRHQACKRYV